MHPVITQAIAAERTREFRAHAAAAGLTRQLRRSQQSRRRWLPMRIAHAGGGPARLPAARPRRDPRAA
jgi:hypothetical protein